MAAKKCPSKGRKSTAKKSTTTKSTKTAFRTDSRGRKGYHNTRKA